MFQLTPLLRLAEAEHDDHDLDLAELDGQENTQKKDRDGEEVPVGGAAGGEATADSGGTVANADSANADDAAAASSSTSDAEVDPIDQTDNADSDSGGLFD